MAVLENIDSLLTADLLEISSSTSAIGCNPVLGFYRIATLLYEP